MVESFVYLLSRLTSIRFLLISPCFILIAKQTGEAGLRRVLSAVNLKIHAHKMDRAISFCSFGIV